MSGPRAYVRTLLAGLCLAAAGCSGGAGPGMHVENAWMRPVEPGQATAAYFTLVNDSPDSLVLVGVDVPAVEMAMMHETVKDSAGNMGMQEVARFAIAPRGRLEFAPGGNHVMAMQAFVALTEGDTTGIELRFSDGRQLHVTADVHP